MTLAPTLVAVLVEFFNHPTTDAKTCELRIKSRELPFGIPREYHLGDEQTEHSPHPSPTRVHAMKIHDLAKQIELMQPESDPRDIARACLMLANSVQSLDELDSPERLADAWKEVGLRLQFSTDQHAAVTQELEDLAASDPEKFTPDQIWILVRAIKVQGQVLQLYLGDESMLDV